MSNDSSLNGSTRTWLDRISQVLSSEPQDREELIRLLRGAEKRNLIDVEALAMIEGALQVGEMQVRDIMIPRAQMVVVQEDVPPEEFVAEVIESGHSRFPVIGDSRDEVRGILLAKDLLAYFAKDTSETRDSFDFDDAMRPAVFIPESKRLNVLLKEFRQSRNHMAIVVDEYGGVAGLVTIEDVLEQIVGEIDDEHDYEEDENIKRHRDDRYTVKARTTIEEFDAVFGTKLESPAYETVGGLVLHELGHLPHRGEEFEFQGLEFKVLRADRRRIRLLRVIRNQVAPPVETPPS